MCEPLKTAVRDAAISIALCQCGRKDDCGSGTIWYDEIIISKLHDDHNFTTFSLY